MRAMIFAMLWILIILKPQFKKKKSTTNLIQYRKRVGGGGGFGSVFMVAVVSMFETIKYMPSFFF